MVLGGIWMERDGFVGAEELRVAEFGVAVVRVAPSTVWISAALRRGRRYSLAAAPEISSVS